MDFVIFVFESLFHEASEWSIFGAIEGSMRHEHDDDQRLRGRYRCDAQGYGYYEAGSLVHGCRRSGSSHQDFR